MKKITVSLLALLFILSATGYSVSASRTAATVGTDSPIVVMSFNIRYGTANDGENSWKYRREFLVDVLRQEAPDLIGTQEGLRFQLDYIKEGLPGYGEIGIGRADGDTAGEYSAILYRSDRFLVLDSGTFWFSDTPEVPGSKHWGNTITRICTWARFEDRGSGESFYLYNLHFDHQSQTSRERSAELLAATIHDRADPDPVIVTGDFNAAEGNRAIRYLKGESPQAYLGSRASPSPPDLRDSFRVLYPELTGAWTMNAFGDRRGPALGKIDYVLVDDWWQVVEAAIVRASREGRYPSDHFPVTARLVMR